MWGEDVAPHSPWDGNGLNHLTHKQLAVVDEALVRMQDFAGDVAPEHRDDWTPAPARAFPVQPLGRWRD
jgi:hypothetical protein